MMFSSSQLCLLTLQAEGRGCSRDPSNNGQQNWVGTEWRILGKRNVYDKKEHDTTKKVLMEPILAMFGNH